MNKKMGCVVSAAVVVALGFGGCGSKEADKKSANTRTDGNTLVRPQPAPAQLRFEATKVALKYAPRIPELESESTWKAVNIETTVLKHEYSAVSDEWLIKMEVRWNGALTGDLYVTRGWLNVKRAGRWSYTAEWRNDVLSNWRILKGFVDDLAEMERGSK